MSAARAAVPALLLLAAPALAADNDSALPSCGAGGVQVQVLGSGGAALAGGRAASGYLIWIDGRPRALIDLGAGTALRFQQSGARAADIDLVLFTRLHADQTLDFPALVAAALHEGRRRTLPLFGPVGNRYAPSTVTFVRTLLDGTRGAYRHLGSVLSPLTQHGFKLEPHDVRPPAARVGVRRTNTDVFEVYRNKRLGASAAYMTGGAIPALAWRLQTQERAIVFTGATGGDARLERLAHGADLLVSDYATPESNTEADAQQPTAAIGRLAAAAQAKHLVLPRRMRGDAEAAVRAHYAGPLAFADDLDCFAVP